MSLTELAPARRPRPPATSDVDIVIPVYNEEAQLRTSVLRLRAYLARSFPFSSTITIVDNASTDHTWSVATELASTEPGVQAVRLDQKGRGRALRAAWSESGASVVAYMDVDLATGLDALAPLVAPLLSGHSDLAIGTRLAHGAHVVRGVRREFISRGYNALLRSTLRSACTDAQCGFKAVRREVALELLPMVQDEEWFFDTELLVTAQRLGLRIHEVPVHWVDDTDSRVEVIKTALGDLRGVWRLLVSSRNPDRSSPAGSKPEMFADELLRFAGVGVMSTVCYVVLFAAFRSAVGSYVANALAIGICSLANAAAHRSLADAAERRLGRWQRRAVDTALVTVSLGLTALALAASTAVGLDSLVPELIALAVGNVAAAAIRFAVLRTWVFRPAFGLTGDSGPTASPSPQPIRPPGSVRQASGTGRQESQP